MKENLSLFERAKAFILAHHRRKIWHRVITVMAVLVVFVTTYMLVLPALTMVRGELICGMEEHVHKSECYTTKYIFTCGMGDSADHEHTDDCLTAISVLTCEIPEHYHDDSCYAQPTEEGAPAAQPISSDDEELIIEDVVEQEAFPENAFGENGLNAGAANNGVSLAEDEETETETETEPVYYCGLEEHKHSEACFDEEGDLICEKPVHVHSEECLVKETETETESETETMPETEAATEAASETETATEAVSETEAASEAAPETEAETGRTFVQNQDGTLKEVGQSESETEALAENETETDTTNIEETETESETESESEAVSETEEASEAESETEEVSEAETESETEAGSEAETESETGTEEAPAGDYMGVDPGLGFEDNGVLSNGIEPETEETESNSETGAQYICGLAEHTHNEDCYDEEGNLVCGLEEHEHSDLCYGLMTMADESQNGVTRGPGTDLLADPNTTISGSGTTYNSETGEFKTNLRFDYELKKSDIRDTAKYEYYITIPDGIIVPEGLVGEPKTFNDVNTGNPAGTYEFVKGDDGKYSIKIHFDPTYVNEAGDTLKGFVGFEGFLEKDAYQADGSLKVEFEDNQELVIPTKDITFDHDETFNYDIDISKEGHYEIKDNKLVYTVTIKSLKGTPDPIKFEDILNAAGLNVKGQPEVTVQWGHYKHYTEYFEPKDEEKETKSFAWSYDSTSKKLTMDLPGLKPGEEGQDPNGGSKYIYAEYYEITYEYSLEDLPDDAKISADNTATVESKDTTTGELVTDSSSKHIDVSTEMTFTKGGWYNSSEKYIEWTLTLNSNKLDIVGATIEDEMLPRNVADITVDPNEGWELGTDGKIHFTAIGDTGVNTNAYTIKYRTPVETAWDGTTEKNSATFDWDGTPGGDNEKTASQEVTTSGGSVDKQFVETDTIGPDDTTVEVTWKTKIVVPDGGLPASVVLTDTTSNPYSEDDKKHYMTPTQIKDLVESIEKGGSTETITWPAGGTYTTVFTDESGKTYTYEEIQKPENANVHIVKFEITIQSLTAPAGEYWFTYNTTADIAGAQRGANIYYNNVEIGGKKDGDTYTFREGGVVKTDGNNQSGTTDVRNEGTLSWKVKASVDSRAQYKELKIVDKLPEHILLSEIAFDYNKLTINGDGTFEGTANGYKISGKYNKETGEVEALITRENPDQSLDPNKEFEILYTCSVDKENLGELEEGQKYTFTNNVTVYKDGIEFGKDQQTQTWTEQIPVVEEKKIEKSGVWDNDNRQIDYEVVINPKAEDLVLNSDELTLTDTLEYVTGNNQWGAHFDRNVSLIQGSVRLYEAQRNESGELVRDEKGKLKKGELITDWEWVYNEESKPDDTWGEKITNTITGKIPDGKALILVYSYRVQMNDPSADWHGDVNIEVSNRVRINGTGIEDDSNNKQDAWEGQSSSGGVYTDKNYTFYKVEKGSYGVALKDAKFSIYEVDDAGNETKITESTTDTSGKFQIVWQNEGPFKKNTLYYAVEEEAPNGYIKPENPPKYYFYFSDGTDTDGLLQEKDIPEGAVDLSATSHAAYIENEKNDTDIEVDKKWLDADGNDVTDGTDGKVEFTLYRKESLTPPDLSASEESSGSTGSTGGSSGGSNEIVIKWNNLWDQIYRTGFKANPGDTVEIILNYEEFESCAYGYTDVNNNWKQIDSCPKSSDGKIKCRVELGDRSETEVTIKGDNWQTDLPAYDPSKISFRIVSDEEGSTTPDPDSGSESGGDSGEDPSGEVVEGTPIGTYSIEKASNWIWRSKDVDGLTLPKVGTNAEGETVYYTYYIKETNAEFYDAVYSANNTDGIVSGTITVTNKKPEKELIGLSVKKQWDDKGAPITGEHESVQVQLYKKSSTGEDQPVDSPQTLSKENGWTYSWTDLDPDAEYYVEEVGDITGYDVTYSVDGGEEEDVAKEVTVNPGNVYPTLIIKNTLKTTEVEVEKLWLFADGSVKTVEGTSVKLKNITVKLYRKNADGEEATEVATVELGTEYANKDSSIENGYSETGWGYKWSNLPEGEYYVEEKPTVDGFTVTYKSVTKAEGAEEPTTSEPSNEGSEVVVKSGKLVVINRENPTEFKVEKVWSDGNEKHTGDSVTVELYSSTTPPETEKEVVEPTPTDPTPGKDTDTEQTETDSEEPEKPEDTVTPTITVNVGTWLNTDGSSAAPATAGWIWSKVLECGESGEPVNGWDGTISVFNGNLQSGWTLSGALSPMKKGETKYYIVQYRAGGIGQDGTPNAIDSVRLDGNSGSGYTVHDTKTDGDGYEYKIIRVTGEDVTVSLTATLRDSTSADPTDSTDTVSIPVSIGNTDGKWQDGDGNPIDPLNGYGWICAWRKSSASDWNYWNNEYQYTLPQQNFGNSSGWQETILLSKLNKRNSSCYHIQVVIVPDDSSVTIGGDGWYNNDDTRDNNGRLIWKYDCDIDVSSDTNIVAPMPIVTTQSASNASTNGVAPASNMATYAISGNYGRSSISTPPTSIGTTDRATVPPTQTLGEASVTYTDGSHELPQYAEKRDTVVLESGREEGEKRTGDNGLTGTYSNNGWTYTWDNLPKTNEKGETLYYYVKEADPVNGSEVEYDYSYWNDKKHSEGYKGVTITNTPPPTMDVTVNKMWATADKEPGLDSVEVVLKNSAGEVAKQTLSKENGWSHTWSGLPIDTYYVEEVLGDNASKFDVSYGVSGTTVTITNTSTSVSVEKKWVDRNGQESSPVNIESITVQLYNSDGSESGEKVVLNAENRWQHTWSNLKPGSYYVEEEGVSGYTATYTCEGTAADTVVTDPEHAAVESGTITITNYEDTEIEVKKVWGDKRTSHEDIQVNLYSSTTPPNTEIVEQNKEASNVESTMTLSLGVTDWVDDDKNEVEPTLNGSVWMTVQACDSTGEPLLDANGEAVVYANSLTASNNWHQTTQELPATVKNENGETETQYYLLRFGSGNTDTQNGIQELNVLNGPNETNGIVISGDASDNGKLSYNLQAIVTGTGTSQPRISNTRNILLNSNSSSGEATDGALDLPIKEGQEPLDTVRLGDGKYLTDHTGKCEGSYGAASSWEFTWKKLPTVNEKGERLYYYVEEVRGADFKYNTTYRYEYAQDGSTVTGVKLVTITNTPNKISIKAEKKWEWDGKRPQGADESKFEVTLSLEKSLDGENWISCKESTFSNTNWSVVWTDLDAGYMYRVEEYVVKTSPYTFTPNIVYSWESGSEEVPLYEDGTVTVTNVYTPTYYTLPETGGTGTLPYTVGGALLTALATLLLYIQNKRRKEGQGTS